ncbi:polysaccharide biosynthesis tyrosine autokinase [Bifidobacterium simiarum]|uniref:polysaccharide biosynthesis tyrosine autokinase n=1 Tax=Bifidobacterium simiarum TaxID=2045441 RepID=UPI001BDC3DD3|nr:polysaccharide biosynthesis tyrosine autokinase [Bifidobacterium simiarum]MBT1167166.1 polysaccharide biosynthesis tyrosine autokinase [Bifidobacterium simiarum]
MSISDLLQMIRRRIVTAVITFVVVCAAIVAYTFLAPAKYTATSEVYASYNVSVADATQNSSAMNSGAAYLSTQIQTYPQLAKTEAVLDPVISELGLNLTADDLAGMITVSNPTNTFMVDISVESKDAQQSSDIANAVAKSLSNYVTSSASGNDAAPQKQKSPVQLDVVKKASVPTQQSSPNVPMFLAAAIVLGVVAGIGAALLKDMLNTKVDSSDDVRSITHASSLGTIAQNSSLDESRPVIVAQPAGREAEEFRRIRTNLSFLTTDENEHGRLIVITSTDPSEGKTTISSNIAVALAEEGKRVLLIDADLRHPSVAHKLGIEGHVGLSHVLSGQATPKDVVQKYWKQNLHILPAGKRPANASILLNSHLMTELVNQALTQYDYVLIDTAPLSVSNDATVFGRMAGGLVLVTGKGVVEKKELQNTMQSLKTAEVPILGFVFNFADPKKTHSKNYYYYYYEDDKKGHGRKKRKR